MVLIEKGDSMILETMSEPEPSLINPTMEPPYLYPQWKNNPPPTWKLRGRKERHGINPDYPCGLLVELRELCSCGAQAPGSMGSGMVMDG